MVSSNKESISGYTGCRERRVEIMNTEFENIIEKLEEIRVKKTCNKEKCDTKELCRICVVDDAIEIVKQVGASDDVCEWKYKHPFGDFPSCKNVNSISRDRNWKFCPYCGKKIKVVE